MNKLCLLGAAALIATAFLPDVASAQRGGGGMRGGGGGGFHGGGMGGGFRGGGMGGGFRGGAIGGGFRGGAIGGGGFRGAAISPGFRGGIGGGGFRSAAIGGFRGGAISRGGFRGGGIAAPASAGQFAWPASVVVAFVGAGAAGVCRSQVSGWAWATTATHPTIRIPASFGTATPGSTPATEMPRYELRLDRTRRFTPAGFALGPSYSGLGDLRGLKRSSPQSESIAGSSGSDNTERSSPLRSAIRPHINTDGVLGTYTGPERELARNRLKPRNK